MGVLKLKPFSLYVESGDGGYNDERGNWSEEASTWEKCCLCDCVPTGRAEEIALPDGSMTTYSYVIYTERKIASLNVGSRVKIVALGAGPMIFVVKGFHLYQHQCKIWVQQAR